MIYGVGLIHVLLRGWVRLTPPVACPPWYVWWSRYAFRFPGSDSSVVRSTQRQLILHGKDPASLPRYAAYFTVSSKLYAGLTAVAGGVFQSLAKYEWGRRLLLR